jgi:hypothetical protein
MGFLEQIEGRPIRARDLEAPVKKWPAARITALSATQPLNPIWPVCAKQSHWENAGRWTAEAHEQAGFAVTAWRGFQINGCSGPLEPCPVSTAMASACAAQSSPDLVAFVPGNRAALISIGEGAEIAGALAGLQLEPFRGLHSRGCHGHRKQVTL